jgi:hypothetical protein
MKQPSCKLKPMTLVEVKPQTWCTIGEEVMEYWREPMNERLIPSYLQVNLEQGKVVLSRIPLDGEVRRPVSARRLSLKSRQK